MSVYLVAGTAATVGKVNIIVTQIRIKSNKKSILMD